ncbi:MAG: hypothetical protein NZ869_09350 [Thermoanaerobaculum sp.]|nr:hypothetical protein [Thermoanaerobaculum sp.]MDW7967167.1 hypothetical protein [Thermoanaerobaculum sp.]
MTRGAWWLWLGLVFLVASVGGAALGLSWLAQNVTPLGWTGVILIADGLLARRGASWLVRYPRELLWAAVISVPSWLLFEFYNRPRFWRENGPELWWHYHGLPPWPERGIGYLWAFATITPAVLLIAQLIQGHLAKLPRGKGGKVPEEVAVVLLLVGFPLAVLPLLWPSPYFAADVWLAWPLLLEGVNYLRGKPCLLRDFEQGDRSRFVALLAAGAVCGFIWEALNWVASARWVYTVPFAGQVKLFEMPVLGYFGFLPFAVAVFNLWVLLRSLIPWPPLAWQPQPGERPPAG